MGFNAGLFTVYMPYAREYTDKNQEQKTSFSFNHWPNKEMFPFTDESKTRFALAFGIVYP